MHIFDLLCKQYLHLQLNVRRLFLLFCLSLCSLSFLWRCLCCDKHFRLRSCLFLCVNKIWKKKSACRVNYVNISKLQARAPVFSKRKLDWAQMDIVLKIRKKKSCEGLDKFILSRHAKFHCLTLSSYGGDSGTNKVRTQNIEHRTYIGSFI